MTKKQSVGKRYRLAQVKKLLDLFKGAHGRPASTIEELEQWVASPQYRKATAYDHTPDGKIIPDPYDLKD